MKTTENIVFAYIKQKHINQSKLAVQMGMSNQNLSGRLKKETLPCDFVMRVSKALNHDFFADMSAIYKRETFDVQNVVEEPVAHYGNSPLEKWIEQIIERKISERLK